jgi:hypothetical protein
MMENMEDQNDRKDWNDRWTRQMVEWQAECLRLLEEAEALTTQAEALVALIALAKSQIKRDPPD